MMKRWIEEERDAYIEAGFNERDLMWTEIST